MPPLGRRAAGIAIAAVLLGVAAVAGLVATKLDPDDIKAKLIAAVDGSTGRQLTLDGPLRIAWSLTPTLIVNGASLSNLPGGSRPDIAHAERIEAQIALRALLERRIEIVKLTLIGPNILFETAGGQPNWVFDLPAGTGPASWSLRVRHVVVQNGMVTSRLPARTRVVGIRALDLTHPRDGGPLDLAGTFVYGDNQPFALQASAQPTAGLYDPWTTRLKFDAYDTAATGTGTMTLAGAFDLQVEAVSGSLDKLNALLPEMQLPAMHGAVFSGRLVSGPVLGDLPMIGPARLQFDDADLGQYVHGLTLGKTDIALPAAGGQATIAGPGRYGAQAFTVGGNFGVPRQPDGPARLPVDLTATLASRATVGVKGHLMLDRLWFGGLDAVASVRTPALEALRPMIAAGLPALTDVRFDGHVTVPADMESVRVADAKLLSHAGDLAGDGTFGPGIAVQARLRSASLDLDALLRAFGVELGGPAARTGGRVIPDTPLPWASLRGPALDVAVDAGTLTFRQQAWRGLAADVQLKGGRLAAKLSAAMQEGPAEIALTSDAGGQQVPVTLSVRAPAIPLALVAMNAGLPGPVSGTMRVTAQLRGSGHTVHELAASLDGPFSATSGGGEMSNAALIALTSSSLDALGIKVPAEGRTRLKCFGLAGSAARGVVRLTTIALETTYLTLDGTGEVDLGRESLALKVYPMVEVGGSPVAVPVVVEGPFRAIAGRAEVSGLDKLGLLIDGVFGGDKAEVCSKAGLVGAAHP